MVSCVLENTTWTIPQHFPANTDVPWIPRPKKKKGKILLGALHVCGLGSFWDPRTCGLGSCGWGFFGIDLRSLRDRSTGGLPWDSGQSLRRWAWWGLGSFWDPYTGGLRSFEDPFQMFRGSGSESDPKTIRKRSENDPKMIRKRAEKNPKTIRKRSPQVAEELGPDPKMIPKRSPELNLGISKGSPLSKPPINNKVQNRSEDSDCTEAQNRTGFRLEIAWLSPKGLDVNIPNMKPPNCAHLNVWGKIQIHPTSFFAE